MKKMLNDCTQNDEFYAVRRKEFPHYWLKAQEYHIHGMKYVVSEVTNVLEAERFSIQCGRMAAEKFAEYNDGEVVYVGVTTIKRFCHPPKRR